MSSLGACGGEGQPDRTMSQELEAFLDYREEQDACLDEKEEPCTEHGAPSNPQMAADSDRSRSDPPLAPRPKGRPKGKANAKLRRGASTISHPPGSARGVPEVADYNMHRWADHAVVTMDYVAPVHASRQVIADVAQAAFGPDECAGIFVIETHKDGSKHLQGAVRCPTYKDPRTVVQAGRAKDEELRGKKEDGTSWHLNFVFSHVYSPACKAVKDGRKKAGAFKSRWKFNDMVEYFIYPAKDKEIDETPYFLNCDEATIYRDAPETFLDLIQLAKAMKGRGCTELAAMEELAKYISKGNNWIFDKAMKAFHAAPGPNKVAFVPVGLEHGSLEAAEDFQIGICRWIENTPVKDADGLWVKMKAGMGKTTSMKSVLERYGDQIYVLRKRGAQQTYDETGLMRYRGELVILINDLKGRIVGRDSRMVWPDCVRSLLLALVDGFPIPFEFGNKGFNVTPVCKVIVCSTWDMPEEDEFTRRYQTLTEGPNGSWCLSMRKTTRATPSDLWIKPAMGLPAANDVPFKIDREAMRRVALCHNRLSEAYKTWVDSRESLYLWIRSMWPVIRDVVILITTEDLVEALTSACEDLDDSMTLEMDYFHLGVHVAWSYEIEFPDWSDDFGINWNNNLRDSQGPIPGAPLNQPPLNPEAPQPQPPVNVATLPTQLDETSGSTGGTSNPAAGRQRSFLV